MYVHVFTFFLTCMYKKGGKGGTVHYLKVKKKISSAVLGKIFPMHSYVKFTDSMWSHPTPQCHDLKKFESILPEDLST